MLNAKSGILASASYCSCWPAPCYRWPEKSKNHRHELGEILISLGRSTGTQRPGYVRDTELFNDHAGDCFDTLTALRATAQWNSDDDWKTDSPWRILWACQSRVTGPVNAARFMTAASTSQRRARSAALNAPCAVQLSRIGTLLGYLDIDSLPARLGMPNDNPPQAADAPHGLFPSLGRLPVSPPSQRSPA
jgi:hypothetical protein